MKLKFRADSKDITIFAIFCVILLYLVAIGILNIVTFIESASFWGFNPFPAFTDYFFPTIVLYLIALILIIASASSYFFEREKGLGVKSGKKEKGGYARWAKPKELQGQKEIMKVNPRDDVIPYAGIPMMNNGKEIWVDDGEYHNLIIGATGSGKTQIMVNPLVKLLAKHGESMIVTDPKGEIYEENGNLLREKGYNIVLLNFRDPIRGNSWNPLTLPYKLFQEGNQDKAIELIDDLAANILYDDNSKSQDPFWEKTSADYFAGLSLALFEDAPEEEINLNSISLMTNLGEEKVAGSTYMKEYFSDKDPSGAAYTNASGTLIAPTDTKGSILSVFKQKIKLFASRENLSEMLSYSDFDIKDIGRQKTAVFIIVQDEKKTYHSLVTIFIKQAYETLIDVAQENGGKLPFRTNFILDEFANMPPLKDVTTMITASRSRRMRFNFIIQNFAQLYQVYGKENGETIKGNCGNMIYLISSELAALEEISKMCGEVKSKEKDKTASTPLVTVSDLQRLSQFETIILRLRTMPFKTKLQPNFKMIQNGSWGVEYPASGYPTRERKKVAVFDIKKFVDEKRKKKMEDMFGSTGGVRPPSPGMPPMPGRPPMGGMNGMPSRSPKAEISQNNGFNVDDIVKRIDAKIAELEEEERREKEEMERKNKKVPDQSGGVPPKIDPMVEKNGVDAPTLEPGMSPVPPKKAPIVEKKVEPSAPKFIPPTKEVETPKVELNPTSHVTPPRFINEVPKETMVPVREHKEVESKIKIEKKENSIPRHQVEPKVIAPSITDDQFFDDFFSDDE